MKITKIWFVLMISLVLFAGCDEEFEDINTNPNAVTEIDDEYLFAKAVLSTLRGGNFHQLQFPFASQYGHYYVGQNNSMFIDRYYDYFMSAEYKNLFQDFYFGPIRHINQVLAMTESGAEKENPVRHSMAQIIAIANFAPLVDSYGSVPYTNGGYGQKGQLFPEYDSVESIYKDMLQKLGSAVTLLSSADAAKGYPGADPLYNNNMNNWVRFANSLRLRLAMRIRFAAPELANGIITECLAQPLIEENAQNARNENQDSDVGEFRNPIYEQYGFWNWKVSEFFVEQLKTAADPRLGIFVTPNSSGEYIGIPNGLSDSEIPKWNLTTISNPTDALVGKAATIYYLTAAEVWALRAEATLFGIVQGDANTLYQTAIRKSMEQWGISAETTDSYIETNAVATLAGSNEEQFKQIATQLWIAVLPNAQEGWSNIRRTGYPVIATRTAPKFELGVTNGTVPTRFRYPSSEVNINNDNYKKAIAEQGADLITTKLWWDKRD